MEEEEEQVSVSEEGSREWEPSHYPRNHLRYHRSLSDSQTQFNGWSMLSLRGAQVDDEGRSIVFPPINHEGLHISSTPTPTPSASSPSNHHDYAPQQQQQHKSLHSPCDNNGFVPQPPLVTRSEVGGEVARLVGFGFELLRSKVTRIASSLRYLAAFRGANWSFSSPTGVAAMLLVWWLYVAVRRQRRRRLLVRKESRDHLILLIKEKDEKINQLLHQIAEMNQVLLGLHRDSVSGTRG